jgi:hypothetical protein
MITVATSSSSASAPAGRSRVVASFSRADGPVLAVGIEHRPGQVGLLDEIDRAQWTSRYRDWHAHCGTRAIRSVARPAAIRSSHHFQRLAFHEGPPVDRPRSANVARSFAMTYRRRAVGPEAGLFHPRRPAWVLLRSYWVVGEAILPRTRTGPTPTRSSASVWFADGRVGGPPSACADGREREWRVVTVATAG